MALRITVREQESVTEITLEGRLAGPWVTELSRAWSEAAPRLGTRKVSIDLRDVTYSDEAGKQVLRDIFAQTNADLVTSSPLTKYLAQEISNSEKHGTKAEADNGIDA
jgi:anti-anti-sigma factor